MKIKKKFVTWDELRDFTGNINWVPTTDILIGAVGGLTPGSVPAADADGFLFDNTNLFWDVANNRLGINVVPAQALHVDGNILVTGWIQVDSAGLAQIVADSHDADAFFTLQEDNVLKWTAGFDFTDNLKFKISEGVPGINTRVEVLPGGSMNVYDSAAAHIQITAQANGAARLMADSYTADAYVELQEQNVLKWCAGYDHTDGSYRISQGVLGTNDRFIIASGGAVTIGGTLSAGNSTFGTIDCGLITTTSGLTRTTGTLQLNVDAGQNISCFEDAASGETPELKIYGFRAADALRSLEIGVGVDAADTASFDGVSNFYFDGKVGIGTSSPQVALHINVGDIWVIDSTADPEFVLGEGVGANQFGAIFWKRSDNTFRLATQGNEAQIVLDLNANVGIGQATFGANAVKAFAQGTDTAPTTSPADCYQMWSADVLGVANKAGPHWRSEEDGQFAWHGGAGTINSFTYQDDIADDGSFTLPAITDSAWGFIQAGDNEEYALFTIDNDGDVTLISNSANVLANADVDGKICVGTSAAEEPLVIKNRLGAQKNINLIIWYS